MRQAEILLRKEEPNQEGPEQEESHSVWEQEPGEPDKWFARFEVFRALGSRRSLVEAYRLVAQAEGLGGKRPGRHWTRMARTWRWRERAAAWDAAERTRLRQMEAERRFDAREVRLGMIDRLLEAVFRVLAAAEMDKMGREEARAWLPTLRLFFKDLLQAQRTEWTGPAPGEGEATQTEVTLRADDLLQAQAALERWQTERDRLLGKDEA